MSAVAKRAGVSVSTVSRVINNQPGISSSTSDKVIRIAREMNLILNVADRYLPTQRTHNIGFVGANRSYPPEYYTLSHISDGFMEEARRFNYHLLSIRIDEEDIRNPREFTSLVDKKVDGMIIGGPRIKASFIIDLYNSGIPIILIDNLIRGLDIDCVLYENEESVYQLTRHLISEHNHRRIVFLSGPDSWISSLERGRGYSNAMKEASLKPYIAYMADTSVETGKQAMAQVLKKMPDLTAVVAVNDAVAVGCIQLCKSAGHPVPDKIAIVGFDDICWAELNDPPLTTVKTFPEEMGRQATRRLVDIIERHNGHVGVKLRVATRPLFRQSCGCT